MEARESVQTKLGPWTNKTLPMPDAEGGYVIQLAVFHPLRCLVSMIILAGLQLWPVQKMVIRKGIYGGVDADDLMGIEHSDHCIDKRSW